MHFGKVGRALGPRLIFGSKDHLTTQFLSLNVFQGLLASELTGGELAASQALGDVAALGHECSSLVLLEPWVEPLLVLFLLAHEIVLLGSIVEFGWLHSLRQLSRVVLTPVVVFRLVSLVIAAPAPLVRVPVLNLVSLRPFPRLIICNDQNGFICLLPLILVGDVDNLLLNILVIILILVHLLVLLLVILLILLVLLVYLLLILFLIVAHLLIFHLFFQVSGVVQR